MFIVLEGLDATGKSEIGRLLSQRLGATLYITPPTEYRSIRPDVDDSSRQTQFYYYLSGVHYASKIVAKGSALLVARLPPCRFLVARKSSVSSVMRSAIKLSILGGAGGTAASQPERV